MAGEMYAHNISILTNMCCTPICFKMMPFSFKFYSSCVTDSKLVIINLCEPMLQRLGLPQSGWHGTPGTPTGPIVKKTQRIDVPVDKYPNV